MFRKDERMIFGKPYLYLASLAAMAVLSLSPLRGAGQGAGVRLANLRCEMLHDPLGIDAMHPRFSWEIYGGSRGIRQVAYQLLAATSPGKLEEGKADLWNTGEITSGRSVNVLYEGKALQSGMSCYWKVRIWTAAGASSWSSVHHWSMGLLRPSDWQASWIGLDRSFPWDSATSKFSRLSARYFRKGFSVGRTIEKATVYVSGLGYYRLYVNGRRIGDQVLTPSPTDYTKTVLYNTYDVTGALRPGNNVVGAVLGNGLFFTMRQHYKTYKIKNFGYPKMRLQLVITYDDSSRQVIATDTTWKVTADGPIRSDNIYDGATYDATREMPGWSASGFNDSGWLQAERVDAPGGRMEAQMNEKVRIVDTVAPRSIHYLRPGVYIMDMGRNMAGWVRMRVRGERGRAVTLRFGETLQANGELATANLRDAKATDVYILSGKGQESWAPAFVYHGFRYVEITDYPGVPKTTDFTGEVVSDGLTATGTFTTSNALINRIYENAVGSIVSDYKGLPVDCPQRNERMPWLGDRGMSSVGESFVLDNQKLYERWLQDIREAQTPEGVIPDVAPAFWHYYTDDITWPATYFQVTEMLYRQYGDLRPIREHYRSMQRWVDHIRSKYMTGYLVPKDKYGDWCMPPASLELIHARDSSRITAGELIATAYYYHILSLMQRFARVLGKDADAGRYAALAAKVKKAFNDRYFNPRTAAYDNQTVTAMLLPLSFGMTPRGQQGRVASRMDSAVIHVWHGRVSTGVIGTQWLMKGVTGTGRPDLAFGMLNTTAYPGWGYMAAHGATTTWELWNGNKANPEMCSRNHVMLLGDLVVWLYEDLGGIKSGGAGYKHIVMRPVAVDSLDFVHASYHSIHGLIKSDWTRKGNHFYWNISIPGNTSARVYIPAEAAEDIRESGKSLSSAPGVKLLGHGDGRVLCEIGSGDYSFDSVL
jgi:alpha-L-rhamnosidase